MESNNYDYAGLEDYIDNEEYMKYKKELEERYNKDKIEIDRIFKNIIKDINIIKKQQQKYNEKNYD